MRMIYVDTSVFGGCFEKEFSEYSLKLMQEFKRGLKKIMISGIVIDELEDAAAHVKNLPNDIPIIFLTIANTSKKARELANIYIAEGALAHKDVNDATHIATATLQNADILASWNFKHMANVGKIKHYNAINKRMGYRQIQIRTPREILNP